MGCIGTGATMVTSAIINFVAIDRLFDASVEQQLGLTAADLRGFCYALGSVGLLFILFGALCPLPAARPRQQPPSR